MGAESSTLQGIESLNSTLAEIERKLGVVEDVHLHHERTICQADSIIISGKLIRCNSAANLTVGPVIGLIGHNFARVLVETNIDTEISFNVFIVDEIVTDSRFCYEKKFRVTAKIPTAFTLWDLVPNTHYAVYVGGINCTETQLQYAKFLTLPIDEGSSPRVVFLHCGRVDHLVPGEINMFDTLEAEIANEDLRLQRQRERRILTGAENYVANPIHFVVHNGDFVDVDRVLRSRALMLLDLFQRDDAAVDAWQAALVEAEEAVRDVYRAAFSHPAVRFILRRTGNLFLAGNAEAASVTASLLAMGSTKIPAATTKDGIQSASPALTRPSLRSAAGSVSGGTDTSTYQEDEENDMDENTLLEEVDENAPVDISAAIAKAAAEEARLRRADLLGNKIASERELDISSALAKAQTNEELRMLLLGALLRLARRICWSYFRQLWDENFVSMYDQDLENDKFHFEFLKARKRIILKKTIRDHLNRTRQKLEETFEPGYHAIDRIAARCKLIDDELTQLETEFRVLVAEGAESLVARQDVCNGACIQVGRICLILVETAWEWLDKSGRVTSLDSRFVSIHPDIVGRFQTLVAERPPYIDDGKPRPKVDQRLPPADILNYIMVVCNARVLETNVGQPPRTPQEPDAFLPSKLDSHILLAAVSRWQRASPDRAVLLAHVCGGFAADDEDEIDPETDPRSRLRQLILGKINSRVKPRPKRYVGDPSSSETDAVPVGEEWIVDEIARFASEFDSNSITTKRSYWDVKCVPMERVTEDTVPNIRRGILRREVSSFAVVPVTELQTAVTVTLGPVIGRVTHDSAVVLLEVAENVVVEMVCVDQFTGIETTCSRQAAAFRPVLFTFCNLTGNRSYDVYITGPSLRFRRQVGNTFSFRGKPSFGGNKSAEEMLDDYGEPILEADALINKQRKGVDDTEKAAFDYSLIRGTFCTLRTPGFVDFSEHPEDEERDDVKTALTLRNQTLETNKKGNIPNMQALKPVDVDKPVLPVFPTTNILVLGANRPSWMKVLPPVDSEDMDFGSLGNDRAHLHQGVELSKLIVDLESRPQFGVDLVVHCGYSVDFGGVLGDAISMLTRAELVMSRRKIAYHDYYTNGMTSKSPYPLSSHLDSELDSLLRSVEETLRGAFRMHWSTAFTRAVMQHASHVFVTSAAIDLLTAMDVGSLRELSSELSPFCMNSLLSMVTKLEQEYQESVWAPEQANSLRRTSSVHHLSAGKVAVFTIRPRLVFSQERANMGYEEDNLISADQLNELKMLLHSNIDNAGVPTHHLGQIPLPGTSGESAAKVLILASPIPFVYLDPLETEFSMLPKNFFGLSYTVSEVLYLLDILSDWLNEDDSREVIMVCGGASVGFTSSIEILGVAELLALQQEKAQDKEAGVRFQDSDGGKKKDRDYRRDSISGALDLDFLGDHSHHHGHHHPSSPTFHPPEAAHPHHLHHPGLEANVHDLELQPHHHHHTQSGARRRGSFQNVGSKRIVQLCCGPFVGVCGDVEPPDTFLMHSKKHTFRFKSRHISTDAHCGIVSIRNFHQHGPHSGIDRSKFHRHSRAVICDHEELAIVCSDHEKILNKVMEGTILNEIWNDVLAGVQRIYIDKPKPLPKKPEEEEEEEEDDDDEEKKKKRAKQQEPEPEPSDQELISRAVRAACASSKRLFKDCFALYSQTVAFGLPFHNGSQVEESSLAATKWILDRMNYNNRSVCSLPSSFTARRLWNHFTATYGSETSSQPPTRRDSKLHSARENVLKASIEAREALAQLSEGVVMVVTDKVSSGTEGVPPEVTALPSQDSAQFQSSDQSDSSRPQSALRSGEISRPQSAPMPKESSDPQSSSQSQTGVDGSAPVEPTPKAELAKKDKEKGKVQIEQEKAHPLQHATASTPAENTTAYLCSDVELFYQFFSQLIESQVLLEYFTYLRGFPDGWQG